MLSLADEGKIMEVLDKVIFTVKIAAGSCISIMLAEYMRLNFISSAGIVTLLTILTTKWDTVRLAVNRILSFVVTVCISKVVFGSFLEGMSGNYGSEWKNYFFFLMLLVGISLALKWKDTISVNAVIFNLVQNNKNKEKQLKNDMRYIEESIQKSLKKIAEYMEYLSCYVVEKNVPEAQLLALEEMKEQFRRQDLPKTREEFEGRAVLYHIMMDLEEFLLFKKRFVEGINEKQKNIYWEKK